jgi:PAS domain S-box-containing protein
MNVDATQMVSELSLLKERLDEVEELRRAITAGAVDAFVVGQSDEHKRVLMLSGAHQRYRQLVEDMQQGALTVSLRGEILFANHSFAAMVDQRPIDLFRTNLAQHLAPQAHAQIDRLLAPRAGQDVETALARAGHTVPVRMSLVSASDDFITYIVTDLGIPGEDTAATMRAIRNGDVDALVLDQDQVVLLDPAQTLYQAAVERMQQGAVMLSPEHRIVYSNDRFAAMAGVPRERILGSDLLKYLPEPDRVAFSAALAACQGKGSQRAVRIARADGSAMNVAATLFSMNDGRCMCLFTDNTEQRRHLEADERNRKFLAMLAHEFRNILGPIRNSVELLKLARMEDPQLVRAVESIERQSNRMLQLVEDLRTINPQE